MTMYWSPSSNPEEDNKRWADHESRWREQAERADARLAELREDERLALLEWGGMAMLIYYNVKAPALRLRNRLAFGKNEN